jgi:hypothetical protein
VAAILLVKVPIPFLVKLILLALLAGAGASTGMAGSSGALFLLAGAGVLKYVWDPILPLLGLWGLLAVSGLTARRVWVKLLAVNVLAAVAVLGGVEAWLQRLLPLQERVKVKTTYVVAGTSEVPGRLSVPDPLLGFAMPAGRIVRERRSEGTRPIFDARYTMDARGHRAAADAVAQKREVLFFGCSFMFGQGVNDGETTPAALVRAAPGIAGANLAAIGYGAHQMLAMLGKGAESAALAAGAPVAGVYLAIGDHVRRAAGLAAWDRKGPRYLVDAGGVPRSADPFDASFKGWLLGVAANSLIFQRAVVPRILGEEADERYAAIVAEAGRIFEKRYRAPFLVFYWPQGVGDEGRRDAGRIELLRKRGIPVVDLSGELGHLDDVRSPFLIEGDSHPNRRAHARIGGIIAAELARRPSPAL